MVSLKQLGINQVPQEKGYFTFVGGLNTDASPLNFPDNFSSDEENFILNLDGSRQRRLGLSLEEGGAAIDQTIPVFDDESVEVLDLGLGTRGFTLTYDGRDYLFTYDPAVPDLVLSFTTTSLKDVVPFSSVVIDGITFNISDATYNRQLVGSVFVHGYTWDPVASFPEVSALVAVTADSGTTPNEGIVRCHHWRNVNGNPQRNLLVMQVGRYLQFFNDQESISADAAPLYIFDLTVYKVDDDSILEEDVETEPVNTDYGRGHLFVVHKYLQPFFVAWDEDEDAPTFTAIIMEERDFEGVEDGIDNVTQPYEEVASHVYNLHNKGWRSAMINTFVTDQNRYPSKNMIVHKGLARLTTAGVAETDWTKAFSSDKLVAELFQDVPAPNGHFIRDVFNTTKILTIEFGDSYDITSVALNSTFSQVTITVDAVDTSTGLPLDLSGAFGTIGPDTRATLKGTTLLFRNKNNRKVTVPLRGELPVLSASYSNPTTTFVLSTNFDDPWIKLFFNTDKLKTFIEATQLGTIQTDYFTNIDGYESLVRPTAVAYFAGRTWFAGTSHPKLSHKIFFSQIVENDGMYGKCYQVADPTSEDISDLVASDGGYISIPEADNIYELMMYNDKLLVFADNGIWEIGGGSNYSYFKATDFSVRLIANVGCVNAQNIVIADGIPFFWGEGGIYAITTNEDTGYLQLQDISTGRMQKFTAELSKAAKQQIQGAYDKNEKKIYWLYDSDSGTTWKYDSWLVYDLRINAFSKFRNMNDTYNIRAIYDIENYQSYSDAYKNVKFMVYNSIRTTLFVSELNDITFKDTFEGTEIDAAAYVITNYETHGEPTRRRYGKYLHTYLRRTETGYTANGDEWDPVNPGSCKVQFLWNWTDSSNTGKWSSVYQAYRYPRVWIPSGETDLYGEAVLVSKLKIRGTGKVMRLKYSTEAEKDCHIYGWHMRHDINREA